MDNAIVELKNLRKNYKQGKLAVEALCGIDLKLNQGDFIAVAGPSGSGKTTLMNIIGLIDTPSSGSIYIEGRDASSFNRYEQTLFRRETLGFIFQSFNLLPVLNVFENIELPLLLGKKKIPKNERRERVETLLENVGLADRRFHLPSELSGGQQQRAAIARSLVSRPKIVIADEPTANLDSHNGEKVLSVMKQINSALKTTFIFSTHDSSIWELSNHIIFLRDGKIESERRSGA
ncbi:MAG: ABC transporter ATP-binding protein [Spirochaetaceae bacterium]|jgi:putative ABC transport system ATP-binding protein|nr:ABC transporter ATP-binding protein [Spirochaetaceae bacterium]GMO16865.1 MAG: ABC transporter ATP-binding protein [Termitinemataceae bacterium]